MSLTAPTKVRTLPPAETHVARLYQVIDLGTQETSFKDAAGKPKLKRQVRLQWELPETSHVFDEARGPESFSLGRSFTLTMGDNGSLKPVVVASRGLPFKDAAEASNYNLQDLLGTTVLLEVAHELTTDGQPVAKLASITKLPKAMACPPAKNPTVYYETSHGNNPVYKAMPEWLRLEIAKSPEYKAAVAEDAPF